jgi:hypothetical protein
MQEISDQYAGDHLFTFTTHSGAEKTHDWVVDRVADLFHTTNKVKTQQVARCRGQRCGDIELVGYLTNVTSPVPLVMDLRIDHKRFGIEVALTLVLTDTYITLMI